MRIYLYCICIGNFNDDDHCKDRQGLTFEHQQHVVTASCNESTLKVLLPTFLEQ